MFLSKKNAAYLNKPPKGKILTPRVLPGWGDDDDDDQTHNYATTDYPSNHNLLDVPSSGPVEPNTKKQLYYDWDQLNDMNSMYQCNYVESARRNWSRASSNQAASASNPTTTCWRSSLRSAGAWTLPSLDPFF